MLHAGTCSDAASTGNASITDAEARRDRDAELDTVAPSCFNRTMTAEMSFCRAANNADQFRAREWWAPHTCIAATRAPARPAAETSSLHSRRTGIERAL